MTKFGQTILGKILGGAAKVVLPVVGVITGIGALSGAAKGLGAVSGVTGAFKKVGSTISSLATGAANLVSGETAEQRKMIAEAKADAATAQQKLTVAKKLMQTGMSADQAYSKAGVSASQIPSTSTTSGGYEEIKTTGNNKPLIWGSLVIGAIALLAYLGKKKR